MGRRLDHSAIYILIAATYTPVFAQLQDRVFAVSELVRDHLEGRRDNRKQLWTLFAFELWHDGYLARSS